MSVVSGVAFMKIKENAHLMFKEWMNEAKPHIKGPVLLNLATASLTGQVSNRTVVLRDVLPDGGLVIMGDKRGKKYQHIAENPQVAVTFLFSYLADNQLINRQVRMEGQMEELPKEIARNLFDNEPIYCKIRTCICKQGEKADWDEIKAAHDQLLKQIEEENLVPRMPDHVVAHKIVARKMDFYYAHDHYMADRVMFTKTSEGNWQNERVYT